MELRVQAFGEHRLDRIGHVGDEDLLAADRRESRQPPHQLELEIVRYQLADAGAVSFFEQFEEFSGPFFLRLNCHDLVSWPDLGLARITITEQGAVRTSFSATLPMSTCSIPVRPWVG